MTEWREIDNLLVELGAYLTELAKDYEILRVFYGREATLVELRKREDL
ncbi:hypothetical protein [Enterococcus sp. AZ102]